MTSRPRTLRSMLRPSGDRATLVVDEILMHLAPYLLGGRVRLFDHFGGLSALKSGLQRLACSRPIFATMSSMIGSENRDESEASQVAR